MTGAWSSVIMGFVNGHSEQRQCPCARGPTRHSSGNDGPPAGDYSAAPRKIAQRSARLEASAMHGAGILLIAVMVRSVLLHLQGHEARSHADLTDRDRDESSRRPYA